MAKSKEQEPEEEGKAKGKGKLKMMVFTAVLVAGVGAGAFMLGGRGSAEATESEAAESEAAEAESEAAHAVEGEVVLIDPVTLSLADGHYLKVGMALQLAPPEAEDAAAEEAGGHGGGGEEEPAMSAEETARAVDEAISLFGSKTMEQLRLPKQRQEAKEKLVHALEEAYHGEIVDVYFTAFAMQ
ncbi:MAG TPA: flagellar basal body-associated FliL family protein [Euzebyales bacterium]|nr:flagellar basal body-associated FliL family protein [Euzebyales bacterium]